MPSDNSATKPPKRIKKEIVYRSFVLQKQLKKSELKLWSTAWLTRQTLVFFKKHWLPLTLLTLFFFLLVLVIFGSQFSNTNLLEERSLLEQRYGGGWRAELSIALALLPKFFNQMNQQFLESFGWFVIFNLFFSLIVFWLLRQLYAKKVKSDLRLVLDAFYFGPAQIVPYLILVFLLFIQLLPAIITLDFATQIRDSVLQTNWEQLAALLVVGFIFVLSLYWVIGGLFSLMIIGLPGHRPFKAWQTSLHLTHRLRLAILGRLMFGGLFLVILFLTLIVFSLWIWVKGTHYIFYVLGLLTFIMGHIYCFYLYQNLLKKNS